MKPNRAGVTGFPSMFALAFVLIGALAVPNANAADAGKGNEAFTATVHERASPLQFRVARGALDARQRANDASSALRSALEEPVPGFAAAQVQVAGGEANVIVLGRPITTMTDADAAAAGASLQQYAAELETRLVIFVDEELQRSTMQALALRVFLTVLFAVIGFLTLRALAGMFSRWESIAGTTAPTAIQLLGVPVLSSDGRKAVTAVALMTARWLAYGSVVVLVIGVSLGQFERTRPWLARGANAIVEPLLTGLDALVRALPGLVLAVVLVVLLRAALEFFRLLLEGVAQGRVASRLVRPERAVPARFFVTAASVLVVAPLAAAAAFGRFGAPLEHLALAAGVCALLASVPAAAAATIGLVCMWRGTVKPGDWISVGKAQGEVSSVGLVDFVVVPATGGTIAVPMLALLFQPTHRGSVAPSAELLVTIKRDRPFETVLAALAGVARSVDDEGSVSLVNARADVIECRLRVPIGKGDVRDALVRALLASVERNELELGGADP